jgi:O-antigen ligase
MSQAIVRGIVLLLGVIVALVAGSATANYDTLFLMLGGVCLGALLFVGLIWRYVLGLSLLVAMVGFSWYPMGVALGPDELSYILVGALIFTRIWRPFDRRTMLDDPAERNMSRLAKVGWFWVVYVSVELVWRVLEVRFYGEAGMKNVIKSYVSIIMPTLCIVYFIHRPSAIVPLKNPAMAFLWTLFIGLTLGIGIRIYQNSFGGSVLDDQSGRLVAGPLVIPGILLVEGIYVLRTLGPLAALAGTLFITTRMETNQKRPRGMFLLSAIVIVMGLAGSFLSGGRATIALSLLMIVGVLAVRRAVLPLIACAAAFAIMILSVNVVYRDVEAVVPTNVLRSVAWMVIDGDSNATGDIDASTRWRSILFEETINEWKRNWRTILIGRGYRGFSDTDYMDSAQGGYYEKLDIALQRGATHSLLSDSLLIFGVLGAALYYFLLATQTAFGLSVLRTKASNPVTRNFAWIVAVQGVLAITVGTLGGTFVGMLNALLVIILVLESFKDHQKSLSETGTSFDTDLDLKRVPSRELATK